MNKKVSGCPPIQPHDFFSEVILCYETSPGGSLAVDVSRIFVQVPPVEYLIHQNPPGQGHRGEQALSSLSLWISPGNPDRARVLPLAVISHPDPALDFCSRRIRCC